jgi:ABC-type uncharacterized transport system substrate-binding protein
MRRRSFIAALGSIAAWPVATRAQQSTPVLGLLCGGTPESDVLRVNGFRGGLNEAGFVEGKDVLLEYRWAETHYERMSALAAELVDRKVSLLIAMGGIPSAVAAKKATASIPILIAIGGDPVQLGLVPSLSHPGANLTGISFLINSMGVKQLELLRDMLTPGVVVGFLGNSNNPNSETDKKNAQLAAQALGQKICGTSEHRRDAGRYFWHARPRGVGALVVGADFFLVSRRDKLIGLAARQRLPAVYPLRDFVTGGGLMSYGTDLAEGYRSLGLYAGRILMGEKPADLRVQQSTKIELVINLKTAKALDLDIPPSLLARADEVIE